MKKGVETPIRVAIEKARLVDSNVAAVVWLEVRRNKWLGEQHVSVGSLVRPPYNASG